MTLARVEVEDLAGAGVERLVTGFDADRAVDDDEDSRLAHLMLTERFAGAQLDEDDALGAVAGVEDDRRPRAVRRFDLLKCPMLHGEAVPDRRVP